MALIVLDASVIIALLDPGDALHRASRREFERVAAEDVAIPASALAETLVGPARVGKLEEAWTRIQSLDLRVAPAEESVALEAARLRGRHRELRLPDALVIATGEVLGAASILTGDRRWKPFSRRVTVIA
ncbi:MAG: type II toxin-antitoxin system VapC family toxin [Candidatus Dormibacteria bacterium]